ncbi:MAG: phosphatidylcholine/phosphatidylserine synthase [Propionibacteriaceae bacterium]|jgi:CDP-diacylglycerol--serine O-phosphatidyltransferase|nr:phosphatidylcholine/phosphatidylserine synthase [Propionibacteriaceae bacterium]
MTPKQRQRRFTVDSYSSTPRDARPVAMLPNLLTLLALACGLTAIRFAIVGNYRMVVILIVAEALLDASDGRVARALGATSSMGEQLDSLADAIGFGVAPAIVTYTLISETDHRRLWTLAWFAAMVYVSAIVLRLARFNTDLEDDDRPDYLKEFFIGVPAPAASWLALAPVIAMLGFGQGWWSHPIVLAAWLILVAALAFSRIPTLSFKKLDMPSPAIRVGLLFVALLLVAGVFTHPAGTMLVVLGLYFAHIPFAIYQYSTRRIEHSGALSARQLRALRRAGKHRRPRAAYRATL